MEMIKGLSILNGEICREFRGTRLRTERNSPKHVTSYPTHLIPALLKFALMIMVLAQRDIWVDYVTVRVRHSA